MSVCMNCGHSQGVHPMIGYGKQGYTGMRCMHVMEERDPQTKKRVRCKCKEYKENPWGQLVEDARKHDRP